VIGFAGCETNVSGYGVLAAGAVVGTPGNRKADYDQYYESSAEYSQRYCGLW